MCIAHTAKRLLQPPPPPPLPVMPLGTTLPSASFTRTNLGRARSPGHCVADEHCRGGGHPNPTSGGGPSERHIGGGCARRRGGERPVGDPELAYGAQEAACGDRCNRPDNRRSCVAGVPPGARRVIDAARRVVTRRGGWGHERTVRHHPSPPR